MRCMFSSEQENRKKSFKVGPPPRLEGCSGVSFVPCAVIALNAVSTTGMIQFKLHRGCILTGVNVVNSKYDGKREN